MRYTVIKQTIKYTSGLFRGQVTERYIKCYSEREKRLYMAFALVYGSPVELIKAEIL